MGEIMKLGDVESKLSENNILPIEIAHIHSEESFEYFLFLDEFEKYLDIIKKQQVKYTYIDKTYVTEDDFFYIMDEEEEEVVNKEPLYEIDEEIGAILMESVNQEIEIYKKYIGNVREIKIISIIEGKEFAIKIDEEWNKKFVGQIITTTEMIKERFEILIEKNKYKKHH